MEHGKLMMTSLSMESIARSVVKAGAEETVKVRLLSCIIAARPDTTTE